MRTVPNLNTSQTACVDVSRSGTTSTTGRPTKPSRGWFRAGTTADSSYERHLVWEYALAAINIEDDASPWGSTSLSIPQWGLRSKWILGRSVADRRAGSPGVACARSAPLTTIEE